MIKLLDVSKNVIAKYTAEQVYEEAYKWAEKYDMELADMLKDKEYSLKVLGIERGNVKPRRDIAKWSDVKENIVYMYPEKFDKNTEEYELQTISNVEEAKQILSTYIQYYKEEDDKDTWFNKIKDVAEKYGYAREVKEYKQNPDAYKGHVGDVSTLIRIALTKRTNTPDMYEIMKVLGKEEVEKRISKLCNLCEKED